MKFEVALREQNYLQGQLQQIQKEKELANVPEDDKAILQKKEIQQLKKQLEHITKNFNTISSNNQKKRNHINTLRKERTLYDHIFKTLEYQILNEENQLLQLLKKNQKDQKYLKEQEDQLNQVKNLTSRKTQKDFKNVLSYNAQENYKRLSQNIFTEDDTIQDELKIYQDLYEKENQNTLNTQKKNELETYEEQEKRIFFLEQLKSDFVYYTNGADIELIEEYMQNGQEQNDQIYDQYCSLEQELQEIIKFNKKAEKEIELCQVKENTQNQKEDKTQQNLIEQNKDLEIKVDQQISKLNNITVFQKGDIQRHIQMYKF